MFRNDDAPRLPIDARLVTSAPVPGVVVVHDERLKVLPSAGNSYDAAADHTADGGKLERVVNELSGLKSQLLGHLVMGMVNEGAAAGGGAAAGAAARGAGESGPPWWWAAFGLPTAQKKNPPVSNSTAIGEPSASLSASSASTALSDFAGRRVAYAALTV